MTLYLELPRVDPFFFQDRQEILGQATKDVFVGEPAVALFSPVFSPGVADEESTILIINASSSASYDPPFASR